MPTAALLPRAPDDTFWAARRVMAFSDDMIRAIVDDRPVHAIEAAAKHLADVLIQRRDKIGRAYLNAVNPLVEFRARCERHAHLRQRRRRRGVGDEPAGGYTVGWSRFDNATGRARLSDRRRHDLAKS